MPGQIKSRCELPWLYYPRSNSVRIINAHPGGGGGGGSLSVNGKAPVAAWVPSLDTAGNGTTTLTDLIGSNDGTFANMDAGTDWVADTDSGGVRALDFDGTNDQVQFTSAYNFSTAGAISLWFKVTDTSTLQQIFCNRFGSTNRFGVGIQSGNVSFTWYTGSYVYRSASITTGWHHLVGWHSGSNVISAYLDGVQMVNTSGLSVVQGAFDRAVVSGRTHDATTDAFAGRVDDIRIFDSALDSTDVAYLYNSGSGRGRTS